MQRNKHTHTHTHTHTHRCHNDMPRMPRMTENTFTLKAYLHPTHRDWKKTYSPFVRSGYRPNDSTFSECVVSTFAIHNETMNIWTHVFGSLLFGYFACATQHVCFCVTLACAFLCSALYHILANQATFYVYALMLDVTGIFSIILGCVGTTVHHITDNAFLERFTSFYIRTFVLLVAYSWLSSVHIIHKTHSVRNVTITSSLLFPIGFWLWPTFHLYLRSEIHAIEYAVFWGKEYILWGACFVCFLLQWPERWNPIRQPRLSLLDYAFNSHSIFHIGVVCCGILHLTHLDTISNRSGT